MGADFSCTMPAKTFVLGEYSVTQDGSAVLLLTEPCFVAKFYTGDNKENLSPPIQKFISLHPQELANKRCDFADPYNGAGGFGASSAEFLAWIKYYYYLRGVEFDIANKQHYQQALQYFIACSSNAAGVLPSGADMIAQNGRGLVFISLPSCSLKEVVWPFANLGLCIARTKNKVATHEHLANIKPNLDFAALSKNVASFMEAVSLKREEGVISSINSSCRELDRLGFLHPNSGAIINEALKHDFCLAAKGCGAMGADVILFAFRPAMLEQAKSFLCSKGLSLSYYFQGQA